MTIAVSPGKLILGGEHAVVHGRPALAMAVGRFARVEILSMAVPLATLRLADRPRTTLPVDELPDHLRDIRRSHRAFQRGERAVREVCPEPEDLLLAAVALAEPEHGVDILVESDIPLGAGLGSSAACLLALLRALRPEWDDDILYARALEAEHFQHGGSSGIDVAASLHGGLTWSENGAHAPLGNLDLPEFAVYDTGRPESTTGECVSAVRATHPADHPVWTEFETVAHDMRAALRQGDGAGWREAVSRNHRLLRILGVVPDAVASVVAEIESAGGAAKLCGAGSIRGTAAGTLLVTGGDFVVPDSWTPLDLAPSPDGTRLL